MERQSTDIHGHEVMRMMLESTTSYNEGSLEEAIIERFGPDSRFCTCSAANMTAKELVQFLADRGKFVASAGGFTTLPDNICSD